MLDDALDARTRTDIAALIAQLCEVGGCMRGPRLGSDSDAPSDSDASADSDARVSVLSLGAEVANLVCIVVFIASLLACFSCFVEFVLLASLFGCSFVRLLVCLVLPCLVRGVRVGTQDCTALPSGHPLCAVTWYMRFACLLACLLANLIACLKVQIQIQILIHIHIQIQIHIQIIFRFKFRSIVKFRSRFRFRAMRTQISNPDSDPDPYSDSETFIVRSFF
jgi:hypothetical protein